MIYAVLLLTALCAVLAVKLYLVKKSAREMKNDLEKRSARDTNTGLRISSRDKDMQALAACLNVSLRELREEHLQYHQGNTELKNAITNISHDLRTPLTAIYGYLDMLEKTDEPEKRGRYIAIMKERAELMKQLTESLFRYSVVLSQDSPADTEEVCVNLMLEESIGSFYPALTERNIVPHVSITDVRVVRKVNRAELSRVFANILSNAVKYSDGDLDISLSDTCEVTFANTAKGLSAVEAEQLFDRFYTVETARHSTGLGLSIARTLIERIGGSITAEYRNSRLTITVVL